MYKFCNINFFTFRDEINNFIVFFISGLPYKGAWAKKFTTNRSKL